MMLAEAASVGLSVGEVMAIVGAVVTPVAAAFGAAVKLFLAERAETNRIRAESDARAAAFTTAILAERAASDARVSPLLERVGKLTDALTGMTEAQLEVRNATISSTRAVDRNTAVLERVERRFPPSSSSTPAVKP